MRRTMAVAGAPEEDVRRRRCGAGGRRCSRSFTAGAGDGVGAGGAPPEMRSSASASIHLCSGKACGVDAKKRKLEGRWILNRKFLSGKNGNGGKG